jgi:hypothetical protein
LTLSLTLTLILGSAIFAVLLVICNIANPLAQAIEMDVKCTVYEHSDDVNGNNVDVRILVMGLQPNNTYTAKVIPDHNPPTSVTTETDYDGIFWVIAKIPNGEKSILFNVDVYQGNNPDGRLVSSGDDDAPCYGIASRPTSASDALSR